MYIFLAGGGDEDCEKTYNYVQLIHGRGGGDGGQDISCGTINEVEVDCGTNEATIDGNHPTSVGGVTNSGGATYLVAIPSSPATTKYIIVPSSASSDMSMHGRGQLLGGGEVFGNLQGVGGGQQKVVIGGGQRLVLISNQQLVVDGGQPTTQQQLVVGGGQQLVVGGGQQVQQIVVAGAQQMEKMQQMVLAGRQQAQQFVMMDVSSQQQSGSVASSQTYQLVDGKLVGANQHLYKGVDSMLAPGSLY